MSDEETTKEIVAEATAVISSDPLDGVGARRRRRTEEAPAAEAPVKVSKQKYLVINGAIAPNGGGRADLIQPGTVVELTNEQAKHYNAMGYLKPHIED
jgi:hypothetical protein